MVEKRILVMENHLEVEFMKDLFSRSLNREKYELKTIQDMSDDRYFREELPEDFDIYWLHISGVQIGTIEKIREAQSWSKFVLRSGGEGETVYAHRLLKRKIADAVINRYDGLDERRVIQVLGDFGVEILLPKQESGK